MIPDWVDEGSDGMKRLTIRGFTALCVESLRELEAREVANTAELRRENEELTESLAELRTETAELRAHLRRLESSLISGQPHPTHSR